MKSDEPILGLIWDGTGYGSDGQIWGGEVFIKHQAELDRIGSLEPFPVLAGDKMAKEPRLSALSLCREVKDVPLDLMQAFTPAELKYYSKYLHQPPRLMTTSMGRLFDGVSALLGLSYHNTFEGEAAMQLEFAARKRAPRIR